MAAKNDTTRLQISARETASSRATRRLRRAGLVPGILYGRGQDPVCFSVDARELRHALASTGAVIELNLDGETTSAVLKDSHRHPVRGELLHVDMLRVDLNKPIHAVVPIELVGVDDAPGVKEGGILEHVTREVNVEALPANIPETLQVDVSAAVVGDTILLGVIEVPADVTVLDDLEETVVATLTPPRLQDEGEGDEIESETEVVGEGGEVEGDDGDGGDDDAASDD